MVIYRIMPKVYRKKTVLEIALSPFISAVGRMPTPKELSRSLGGDPSGWGRILKGQQKIAGEYHARLKLLDGGTVNISFKRQAAEASEKYAGKTRKGRIAPHVKNIFNDMYRFCKDQIIKERMSGINFEDSYEQWDFYRNQEIGVYDEGAHYPRTEYEEQALERDFIDSLT